MDDLAAVREAELREKEAMEEEKEEALKKSVQKWLQKICQQNKFFAEFLDIPLGSVPVTPQHFPNARP